MIEETKLNELKELCAKATPAPWSCDMSEPDDVVIWGPPIPKPKRKGNRSNLLMNVGASVSQVGSVCENDEYNGKFIALSRELVPELIAEIERLEEECKSRGNALLLGSEILHEAEEVKSIALIALNNVCASTCIMRGALEEAKKQMKEKEKYDAERTKELESE